MLNIIISQQNQIAHFFLDFFVSLFEVFSQNLKFYFHKNFVMVVVDHSLIKKEVGWQIAILHRIVFLDFILLYDIFILLFQYKSLQLMFLVKYLYYDVFLSLYFDYMLSVFYYFVFPLTLKETDYKLYNYLKIDKSQLWHCNLISFYYKFFHILLLSQNYQVLKNLFYDLLLKYIFIFLN